MHEEEGYFSVNGNRVSPTVSGFLLMVPPATVYGEAIKTVPAAISGDFERFMKWADERRHAADPNQCGYAAGREAGCRLRRRGHRSGAAPSICSLMGERIKAVREMIVSKTSEQRKRALDKLLPMQRSDFEGIYEAMEGRPVTIRYLDPPLHEFLPTSSYDITQLAKDMHIDCG